jgi:long-chain acyl-CoA synthetase
LLKLPLLSGVVRRKILKELGLAQTRVAASGSAPLPVELLMWYRRLGLNLIEGYGMTETGITHVPLPGMLRPGYVGTASPDAETRISQEGEIQIKGAMNMAGYYRNPELTKASFTADGYFLTGDRGEIDEQGRLRIVGRLKEEFKTSKGKYVVPAPIEKELNTCGLFESACVLGSGMPAPFAAVVLTADKRALATSQSGQAQVEEQLKHELQQINQKLERHEQLRFFAVVAQPWSVENGYLTPTLKVRRSCVEDLLSSFYDDLQNSGQPVFWLKA